MRPVILSVVYITKLPQDVRISENLLGYRLGKGEQSTDEKNPPLKGRIQMLSLPMLFNQCLVNERL
ncbi:hypothetical protein C9J12_03440 [Photobacterium frigidiphilum]|uniref:Uncharacterized protein n=1 Tax=Photobacterium frigidiphilum TaxID=264736 RepID=A0A2T3JPP1_9GAMM|nr:hypothetical protein C9J12_03440 [Photobacterium frigidiphilum]